MQLLSLRDSGTTWLRGKHCSDAEGTGPRKLVAGLSMGVSFQENVFVLDHGPSFEEVGKSTCNLQYSIYPNWLTSFCSVKSCVKQWPFSKDHDTNQWFLEYVGILVGEYSLI